MKNQTRNPKSNLAVALLLCISPVLAGMSSLKVMPGVREAGMGDAGVASAFGPQAIAWNPAASASVEGFGVVASYTKWFLDTHQQSVYLARGLGLVNLGFGITSFTAGSFEHRNDVPSEDPLGLFVPSEFNLHLNLSRQMTRIMQAGVTTRYYYSKIMEESASGFGFDLGVRVMPLDRLVLGASLVDFGWNQSYYYERFRLPTRARIGALYGFDLGQDFVLNLTGEGALHVYTQAFNLHSGVEFVWHDAVALRAGYEKLDDVSRLGFSFGLQHGLFRVDYALTTLNSDFGVGHRFSLGLQGK